MTPPTNPDSTVCDKRNPYSTFPEFGGEFGSVLSPKEKKEEEHEMAEKMKCDYCGAIFYKDGFMNAAGDASGIGDIYHGVRGMARLAGGGRNFCSTRCKNAYKSEKGSTVSSKKAAEREEERERQAIDDKKNSIVQAVTMTTYDSTAPEQIVATMQSLVARADEFKDNDNNFLDVARAVQKKTDEGVYQLQKHGVDENDFYFKQALEIKKDIDARVLKKRRSTPLLAATYLSIILPIALLSIVPVVGTIVGIIIAIPLVFISRFVVKRIVK